MDYKARISAPSSEQLRLTVSYEEQILKSKDKYPSIFSPQIEAIVFLILKIIFTTRAVLKIGEYISQIFPCFSWGIFAHVTRLGQSWASENIWWIIIYYIPENWDVLQLNHWVCLALITFLQYFHLYDLNFCFILLKRTLLASLSSISEQL